MINPPVACYLMIVSHLLVSCGLVGGLCRTESRPSWNSPFVQPRPKTACARKNLILCRYTQQSNDGNKDEGRGENSDEEEEETNLPYASRSLAWTNRYRKLIPYESARACAMSLGLRSKAEWDEYQGSGECHEHGAYLPNRPDLMYADDWVGWDDFLGIMRPYNEARDLVHTLRLHNFDEYERFILADKSRAEGLRIPAKPHIVYRDKGWVSFEEFFWIF